MADKTRPRINHHVVALAYDGLCTFEFGIAVEMFGLERPEFDSWYSFSVCGLSRNPVSAVGGVAVQPQCGLQGLERADTILIPGWSKPYQPPPRRLLQALIRAHRRGARLVSICVGSFVLAATGLLDGKRATTHWRHIRQMTELFPRVCIEPDVLYVDEGDILTSAGSAAGIDLCLHIIRKDFGAAVANAVARRAVSSPHREGGQAQFIPAPLAEEEIPWLSHLLEWAQRKLHTRITIQQLAWQARTSPRTLSRRFPGATGMSAMDWITSLRVQRARELLETTSLSVEQVAERSGFGSAALLRHHFRGRLRLSPNLYRARFRQNASHDSKRLLSGQS